MTEDALDEHVAELVCAFGEALADELDPEQVAALGVADVRNVARVAGDAILTGRGTLVRGGDPREVRLERIRP